MLVDLHNIETIRSLIFLPNQKSFLIDIGRFVNIQSQETAILAPSSP